MVGVVRRVCSLCSVERVFPPAGNQKDPITPCALDSPAYRASLKTRSREGNVPKGI